mmetsp:Transcript_40995/g.123704  ORF Transcript_40995/g.123704 Transcript_40995/m.123704 type:complete len:216 (+) Transcript_40995:11515-12162(+)
MQVGDRGARRILLPRDVHPRLPLHVLRGERGRRPPGGVRGRQPVQAPRAQHQGIHGPSHGGFLRGRYGRGGAHEADGPARTQLPGEGRVPGGIEPEPRGGVRVPVRAEVRGRVRESGGVRPLRHGAVRVKEAERSEGASRRMHVCVRWHYVWVESNVQSVFFRSLGVCVFDHAIGRVHVKIAALLFPLFDAVGSLGDPLTGHGDGWGCCLKNIGS